MASETRRSVFGKTTVAAVSASRVSGANDRIRIALVGCGGMGRGDLKDALKAGKTECVALCDVDDTQSAIALKQIVEPAGGKPDLITRDFRRVIDRKDIDAVIVAIMWNLAGFGRASPA